MGDWKNWYHSKTIWGALIAIGASVLHAAGIDIEAGDQSQIVDSVVNIAGTIGGLVAIYGRITASTAIR